jgi:lipoprotein-anchoring transpeptidase ErfK/SrfK
LGGSLHGAFVPGGAVKLRPYTAPQLDPAPSVAPTSVKVVQIEPPLGEWDANVLARPSLTSPIVGTIARGARIGVRGELVLENAPGCPTLLYYALEPHGFICSNQARPTAQPKTTEPALQVAPDSTLPFRYVMVGLPEGEALPMWASLDDLQSYADPERELMRGDTVAVGSKVVQFDDAAYYVAVDGKVVPVKGTFSLRPSSEWQGVVIAKDTHLPFAWVTRDKTPVFDTPGGKKLEELARRTRVDVLEEQFVGSARWLRVGDGRFVKADQLNEVRKIARPEGTGANPQWIDIDLGEQVVVAYVNRDPVYATLTSSGRAPNSTPRGNYPIWGKVTAITMKSQEYDEVPYYVNKVPWVLFFQAHNALHGAYWHDKFGVVKSHGCANLSPRDARYLFDWLRPVLPPGWTGVRFWDLTQAPVAHVRNSKLRRNFVQERNVGPPDREDEAVRLEAALTAREAKGQQEAAAAQAAARAMGLPAPTFFSPPLAPAQPQQPPALAPAPR